MTSFRVRLAIGSGLCAAGLLLAVPASAQPQPTGPGAGQPAPGPAQPQPVTPSLTVDPDAPGATPHWTITLGSTYCGGYRVGDGVYVSPEPPLALPASVTDGSTLFAGQPATASIDPVTGALRIGPGPGLVQSMVCLAGQRALKVELLPDAGLGLPADPGDYVVDVWTGSDSTVMNLGVTVPGTASELPPQMPTD